MAVVVQVPDEIASAMRLPDEEKEGRARIELACALYSQDVLSLGKAAQLAEMSRLRFGEELARRGIARHYREAHLKQDLGE